MAFPPPAGLVKSKQINVRLTDEQAVLLKQHCVHTGRTAQEAVIAALRGLIDGF